MNVIKIGSENLDKWHQRMESHKRRGDKIIKSGKPVVDKELDKNEQDSNIKNRKIETWERNHNLPTKNNSLRRDNSERK
jgi:hypothetical protein